MRKQLLCRVRGTGTCHTLVPFGTAACGQYRAWNWGGALHGHRCLASEPSAVLRRPEVGSRGAGDSLHLSRDGK